MATDLERLVVQLSADFKAFEKGMARAQGVSNRQFAAIEARARKLNTNLDSIGRQAANSLIAPLSGIGAALGVREIARYADQWTEAGNKIRAAASSAGVNVRSLDQLKDGANEARTELSAYVDLYARLIRSASGVAKSEQEIADATNIVSKAFKAGGASAAEQAAGILQLGQALGSGVLQGDELRSLRENAPILAQAIATEFKTTIAGLKDLGAEGKLTSERVFKAILAAQKPIEAQFKATNATIQDSITRINNEFTAYIGNADESAGASQKLVEALQYLADNFGTVADTVVQFATLIIGALTGRAILGMVAGLGNAVVALGAFLTALRAGTLVAAGFTAALGPIGILAGAAAAAIYLLSDSQAEAKSAAGSFQVSIKDNEAALRNSTDATYAQVDALRQLIAMQLQAAKTAAIDAEAQYYVALSRSKSFKKATGLEFDPFEYATKEAGQKLTDLQAAQFQLEDQLAEADKLIAKKPSGFGGGSGYTPDGSGSGKSKRTRKDEYERDVQRVMEHTAALVAETEAQRQLNPLINDYGFAAEKARMERDLLTAAENAGKEITPQLRAEIAMLAEQYALAGAESAKLADEQDQLRESMEDMQELGKDVLGGFIQDMMNGQSAAESLKNALAKVADKLIEIGLSSVFKGLFPTGASSGGNFLQALFGGFREGGGPVQAGKAYVVGEKRPELFVPNQSGTILPAVPQMPKLTAPSSQAISVAFAPNITVQGGGGDSGEQVTAALKRFEREFTPRVVKSLREAKTKGMI